jgi:uncharacterized membrane protein
MTATTTTDDNNRIGQFKSDVSDMKLKTGSAGQENLLMALGGVLMLVGVVVALVLYASSLNLDDARDIQSNIVLSIAMLAVSVAGAALFLRYSLAKFLRLWLLRQLYEGQANTDRIVEAVTRK